MKADTQRYVGLQNLFRAKAKHDLASIEAILARLLVEIGLPMETVSKEEVEAFVKHSAFLKVVRGRSLVEEMGSCKLKGQVGGSSSSFRLVVPSDGGIQDRFELLRPIARSQTTL